MSNDSTGQDGIYRAILEVSLDVVCLEKIGVGRGVGSSNVESMIGIGFSRRSECVLILLFKM